MKRIFLLIVTNFAVLAVLSVTMQLLGIDRMLAQGTGLNLQGAARHGRDLRLSAARFISLLISKWMAKMATGAHVIDSRERDRALAGRYGAAPGREGRHRHARGRDLRCARVERVRDRREPQASLVAVSTGLLNA